MRRARAATIYDALRIPVGRDGAIKSPTPQSERPVIANSLYAGMGPAGIGAAATTARSSRTFTGGSLMPQGYLRSPADFMEISSDAGKVMNSRSALPNRSLGPRQQPQPTRRADRRRRSTPLAKRR